MKTDIWEGKLKKNKITMPILKPQRNEESQKPVFVVVEGNVDDPARVGENKNAFSNLEKAQTHVKKMYKDLTPIENEDEEETAWKIRRTHKRVWIESHIIH